MTETPLFEESKERLVGTDWRDFAYPIVHDYETPEVILDEIRTNVGVVQWYPYLEAELCAAIGTYVGVRSDWILATGGSNAALDVIARCWFAGRKVVVPVPAFWQLIEAPLRYGARLDTPFIRESDKEPYPGDIADKIADNPAAIVLCSPHNPLGSTLRQRTVEALLQTNPHTMIVVDESYADLDGMSLLPELQHPNLVVVRGFKTFLIPGARVGYIVAHPERLAELRAMSPPFALSAMAEVAAIAVLRHLPEIRAIWEQIRLDLRYLEARLLELGGYLIPSPTLFALWRHPQARRLGDALLKSKTAVLSASRPTIVRMPDDAMRITSRKPQHVDGLIQSMRELLDP